MDRELRDKINKSIEKIESETYYGKWIYHFPKYVNGMKFAHPFLIKRENKEPPGHRPLYLSNFRSSEKEEGNKEHYFHKAHTSTFPDCNERECFLDVDGRIIGNKEIGISPDLNSKTCKEPEFEKLIDEINEHYKKNKKINNG